MSHRIIYWSSLISIFITSSLMPIAIATTITGMISNTTPQNHQNSIVNIAQNSKVRPDKYLTLAVQKYRQRNYPGAVIEIDRAIKLKPDYAIAYDFRGLIKYKNLGDFPGALADFDRALAINPSIVSSYYNRGLLKYLKLNDQSGGIADMEEAVKLFEQKGDRESAQDALDLVNQWKK